MTSQRKNVRIGVVGVGGMGRSHIKILTDKRVRRAQLAAVCDVNPEFLALHPGLPQFTDHVKMYRSGLIDAVLIATPHFAHTPVAIDAFKEGLHVMCEKPLAVHKADAEKMLKACPRRLKFAVMFQMRVSPVFRKVKQMVDDGAVGRLTRVNWIVTTWYRPDIYYARGGWRATWRGEGGGVLINQCPHNLDVMQWICGMPSRLQAFCGFGRWHKLEVEDEATVYMEYPGGANGVFITTTAEAPGTNRFEICGEYGRILIEGGQINYQRNEESAIAYIKTATGPFAKPASRELKVTATGRDKAHVGVLQNFVDAILDGKPLVSPAAEAINQVELTNAMIYSGKTGKAVDLPLNGATYQRFLNKLIAGSQGPRR